MAFVRGRCVMRAHRLTTIGNENGFIMPNCTSSSKSPPFKHGKRPFIYRTFECGYGDFILNGYIFQLLSFTEIVLKLIFLFFLLLFNCCQKFRAQTILK